MDERFLKEEGTEVFTGNELLLKGALEAGCALITGYPGSPVSEVFDSAFANRDLLKQRGVLAQLSNNEALAVARLNGSRMAGARAMAVMKSVGLHVAADGLALGNLSEPQNAGGSVVVVGDDPWVESTQINNDSRFLAQHLHMPVMEPATFQELKDWLSIAFELSSRSDLYLTYLVTTYQADGGGTVWVHPNRAASPSTLDLATLNTSQINLNRNVLLPPRTWEREATLPKRFDRLLTEARRSNLNVLTPGKRRIGFVASGLAYCYLEHAFSEMGLSGEYPILKLGLSYPVDPEAVRELAAEVDSIIVIEEKRGFIEAQVLRILHDAGIRLPLWGKKFPDNLPGIPETRGLNTSLIIEKLSTVLLSVPAVSHTDTFQPLPIRTPTFCPGCPHRDSSSVFLQIKRDFADAGYMRQHHDQKPVDLLFHGETGCFTMLMFEPNETLMHNYSGMGLGGGTGAGADPFITNKQVVFLGDSTFFHSGMLAISDSIKSGQDITYVILDNKTTAMTGHQPTPGTDLNLMGEKTFAQSIEAIAQAMIGQEVAVHRLNPGDRDNYRDLLEKTILQNGVKVVIADKECGLTHAREVRQDKKRMVRRKGYLPVETHINITAEACEYCLECTNVTGCPGLAVEETLYGPKITTDATHCVSDGACAKVKACPAFEEVTVYRKRASRRAVRLPLMNDLPIPPVKTWTGLWSAFTAGVGGQGAGLVNAILVRAAHDEGLRVLFSDKKGLAVRNGGVFAHLLVTRSGGTLSPVIPYGKADLVLGLDLLEAARAADPNGNLRVMNVDRTAAVVNTTLSPTVRMLLGKDLTDHAASEKALRRSVRPDGYWGEDVADLSEHYFGSKLYANLMLLGAAAQLGQLPFSLASLERAVSASVPVDERETNLSAFLAGRTLAAFPERFQRPSKDKSYAALRDEKKQKLEQLGGLELAEAYQGLVSEAVLTLDISDEVHRDLALRIYDLILYEDMAYAERYVKLVLQTAAKDRREWDYRATKAVIWNAFKVMAIKDEVYVSHLLTSPEKRERDAARFNIDTANGDALSYRHFNRPEFVIFGRRIAWSMQTRDWQLHLMKRLKFLRRLLPGWHEEERKFRDWYLGLVEHFEANDEKVYAYWVKILSSPSEVRGYRDLRYRRMREARQSVSAWVDQLLARSGERQALSAFCLGSRK